MPTKKVLPRPHIQKWTASAINSFIKVLEKIDPKSSYFHGSEPTLADKRKAILALYDKKRSTYNKVAEKLVLQ